jgi:hypothetical protein
MSVDSGLSRQCQFEIGSYPGNTTIVCPSRVPVAGGVVVGVDVIRRRAIPPTPATCTIRSYDILIDSVLKVIRSVGTS